MILKHRDTEVLRFDWVKPFGVTNVELNHSAERFLPLAYRDRVIGKDDRTLAYETESWLLHRTAPMRREGIANMLSYLGFYPDDPSWRRELITFCRALSLNDVHWIAKDDSTEKWADVNLYDNPFSTAVASMAFTGERRSSVRGASSSPEYSTNGNLRKCWRRVDGKILLYKGGARPADEMIDRIKGLEKFEFRPHHEFVMSNNRLEVSQYFLQNRIAKIVKYGAKADKYLKIRASSVRINPLISDKMLKKAKEAEDLRKELKATLKSFPRAKTDRLAVLFKTTTRTIARHIKSLQEAGELKRVGSRKTGYWQVVEKEAVQ